jgi:hypothetical protein
MHRLLYRTLAQDGCYAAVQRHTCDGEPWCLGYGMPYEETAAVTLCRFKPTGKVTKSVHARAPSSGTWLHQQLQAAVMY